MTPPGGGADALHLADAALGAAIAAASVVLARLRAVRFAWSVPAVAVGITVIERARGQLPMSTTSGWLVAGAAAVVAASAAGLSAMPSRAGRIAALMTTGAAAGCAITVPDTEVPTAVIAATLVLAAASPTSRRRNSSPTVPPLALTPVLAVLAWSALAPSVPTAAAATALTGFGLLLTTAPVLRVFRTRLDDRRTGQLLWSITGLQLVVAPLAARAGVRRDLPGALTLAATLVAAGTAIVIAGGTVLARRVTNGPARPPR